MVVDGSEVIYLQFCMFFIIRLNLLASGNYLCLILLQSLLSPQSRLVVTSSSDDPSSDGVLNSDAITVEVPVDDVRVGDFILVLPGETIPVDVRSHTGFML